LTGILLLQDSYLNETDAAKRDQILSDFYIELIKLGKFLLSIKKLPNSEDDIYDLASDVCARLIERQAPVIKSAPSAYISSALFFKNKESFHSSLEDIEEPSEESFENSLFISEDMESIKEDLISYSKTLTTNQFIQQLLEETIYYQIQSKSIKSQLNNPADRTEYSKAIRKLHQYLKEKISAS